MAQLPLTGPIAARLSRSQLLVLAASVLIVVTGIVCMLLSPFVGAAAFDSLWAVEPLGYIGGVLLVVGLGVAAVGLFATSLLTGRGRRADGSEPDQSGQWREVTMSFFNEFDHDLGRPLRRITGRQRELRAALRASGKETDPEVMELLDEIERQAVNYRLMLSNIQVLVQSEAPGEPLARTPVEPSEVVRRIVERYVPVAREIDKEITWWAEPQEFGMVSSNSHAIEHIVANLVDNAVTHAHSRVEVSLSRDDSHFRVNVWDDGPGIPSQYLEFLFERGWTPETGRREEKTSSGLGLFIARTLARHCGGELSVESVTEPQEEHHTSFLLAMPLQDR